jgi:hypothetical protein
MKKLIINSSIGTVLVLVLYWLANKKQTVSEPWMVGLIIGIIVITN